MTKLGKYITGTIFQLRHKFVKSTFPVSCIKMSYIKFINNFENISDSIPPNTVKKNGVTISSKSMKYSHNILKLMIMAGFIDIKLTNHLFYKYKSIN